ncbi:hypothetical protein KFE25_000552 [Diacronema lutheri]|uniref:BTB domain-containing protein n=2 Tax=Diacronema lutheri TaxID=2081491 RepID=A0A8J5XQQ2_DIALT|nr:hypothetical protein KFE25_000552 [Diacronema lutheri]
MAALAQSSTSGGRKRPKVDGASVKPVVECKLRLDLQALYEDGSLSDVRLHVGLGPTPPSRTFACHRAILAASSTYFKAIFTSRCKETGMGDVTLQDVDPTVFEEIVRLCYGGPVRLDRTNVVRLMQSAEFYGISDLRDSCTAFFQQALSVEVYYELLDLAMTIRCDSAQQLCIRALAKDFSTAIDHAAFQRISGESLKAMLQDEALSVPREEEVLRALVTWLEQPAHGASASGAGADAEASAGDEPRARAAQSTLQPHDLDELLQLVRWPWLSSRVLCAVQDDHPCLTHGRALDRLLLQALRFHALPAEQRAALAAESTQYQPRPGLVQLGELLPDGLMTDMTFVWNVHGFASLTCESIYSPPISVNGNRWSIFMWPRRRSPQNGKETEWVSIYLNSVDVKSGLVDKLPSCAFELTVKNYKSSSLSITREYEHAFDSQEVDWGLSRFVQCSSITDPAAGFLNGGTLTIVCAVHQIADEDDGTDAAHPLPGNPMPINVA